MENPIQYRNTDNPSQMGGLATQQVGVNHNAFIIMISPPPGRTIMIYALWLTPPGRTITGGLMKTLHRRLLMPGPRGETSTILHIYLTICNISMQK